MASRARSENVVDSSTRVRPSPLREDELYLGPGERTFVTHYRAAGSAFTILVPPLFEEAARTRKVLVNVARDLAAAGIDAVRFDYPGTGLSAGSTEELTLTGAFETLREVVGYCHRLGAAQVHLLGFRFGGYLALSAATQLPLSRLIVWEPVLDLAAYFQDLLKIEMSNQLVTFGKVRRGRDQLLASLRAGEGIVVDGNRLCPGLHREMEAAPPIDLTALVPFKGRLTLCFWDNKKLHEAATRIGLPSTLVGDVKFSWKHIRTLEPRSDALFRETVRALKE
jgi:pimeloyl-ACP methyl ester carboxylesterase